MFTFTKLFLVALASTSVLGAPNAEVENRQVDSVLNGASSVFGEVTGGAASVFSEVTAGGASVVSEVTAKAGELFTTVTSVGGSAFTVVTQGGGEAITLAQSGAGVLTTWGGSVYTKATAAAQSGASEVANGNDNNAAYASGVNPIALLAVAGGALFGAIVTII